MIGLHDPEGDQEASRRASASAAAIAQTTAEPDRDEIEIVVTGARTVLPVTALPLTVDVLGGEDFQRQVAVSGSVVDAVAARLPAFSPTREKLTGSGETLRGRSPLFAINGVPQSTPIRDGSRDGHTIDAFFIDRVEIIYGSNALQGIGATGGVVNQVTVSAPRSDGAALRTLLQVTAQDRFQEAALGAKGAALLSWRAGSWDATLGAAIQERGVFLDGEGRRIGIDGAQGDIQDSRSWSMFGQLGYQLSGSARLQLVANQFELSADDNYLVSRGNRASGIPTSSIRGTSPGEPASNRAQLLSLSLTESDFFGGTALAQLFFNRTRDIFGGGVFAMFQDPAIDPSGRLFEQSVNGSLKLGGKISYERAVPGLEDLVLIGGLDWLSDRTEQSLLLTSRQWVPETSFGSLAPFAQANLRLLDGIVRLAGGLRYEAVRLDVPDYTTLAFYGSQRVQGGRPSFGRLLKNGGLVIEPISGMRAYLAYAEGYTIPDVGRILRAVTEPDSRVETLLNLQPVVSNNLEFGLEWKRGNFEASATYFRSTSELGALLVRNADGFFDVVRQPIEIEGTELSVTWLTPLPGLSLGAAFAHIKGGSDTDGDGRIDTDLDGANISPSRINLFASWDANPLDMRATVRHYFERDFEGQDPRNDFAGYTLIDLDVGYRFGPHRLSLSIQNLTDEQYITYFSDTQGPTDDLRFFAGRGRTFTLSITSRW